MDLSAIDAHKPDFLADARKRDDVIGAILKDVAMFIADGDYRRAATATVYLLIEIAKKQGVTPTSLLRKVK